MNESNRLGCLDLKEWNLEPKDGEDEDGEGAEEWRIEIVSALLEAVDREKASEEVGASSFRCC